MGIGRNREVCAMVSTAGGLLPSNVGPVGGFRKVSSETIDVFRLGVHHSLTGRTTLPDLV